MTETKQPPTTPKAKFRWNWVPGCGIFCVGMFLWVSVHFEDLKEWWKTKDAAVQAEESKGARFNHAMTVPVRTAKEPNFTDETKRWGIEVYRDPRTGQLIYITERGQIQAIPAPK